METKICSKCLIRQDISFFQKDKQKKDGYRPDCKNCRKKYYKINFDKISKRNSEYVKKHRKLNPDKFRIREMRYRLNNPEKVKIRRKKYYENNKIKHSEYFIKKYNNDSNFKLISNIRRRISIFLKIKKIDKTNKTFDIVGCTPEFLKEHLEKQFKEGMSWGNYGFYGWHIDHIIPLSSAKTEEEIYKLCHYTNLQPLWAEENLKKGNKVLIKFKTIRADYVPVIL